MRGLPNHLLLAAACMACAPCLAQEARARADVVDNGVGAAAFAGDRGMPATAPRRSAFGRVMDVMIASLQHQARASERPQPAAAPVRTTAAGTPLGIEVGGAFSAALDGAAGAPAHTTGTGGVAADGAPRATPPEPRDTLPANALDGTALAGPG